MAESLDAVNMAYKAHIRIDVFECLSLTFKKK